MGKHSRSHLIMPLVLPRQLPRPPQESREDSLRARYASTLINVLNRRIAETGELDTELADKIEAVLWHRGQAKSQG